MQEPTLHCWRLVDGKDGMADVVRGIDKNDSVARNPCLRRGPLSLDYWMRLPVQFWRSWRVGVFAN